MAEGVIADVKAVPGDIRHHTMKFVVGGLVFLLLVLILEAYKPGLITGPIKNLLGMVGIKSS